MNNDNNDNKLLNRLAEDKNNNSNKKKPSKNTLEQTLQKKGQSQVDLNKVRQALKEFATTSKNLQLNVTTSQVVKYHTIAKDLLLMNPRILTKMLNLETTTHTLTLKHIKLSDNFFDGIGQTVPLGSGTQIRNAIVQKAHGNAAQFNPNSKLPDDDWQKYYKLSKLVSTIRGDPKFPWQGDTPSTQGVPPPPVGATSDLKQSLRYLQAYHNIILGPLRNGHFSVRLSEENHQFMIVIRFTPQAFDRYIDWTYTPSNSLDYAIEFLKKLPRDFVKFSLDHISNLNSGNNNHGISASVVPMFTKEQSIDLVRTAMKVTGFPSRFWQMNELKQKAQKNEVNNFSANFLNTKQSRIKSFLDKVNDLFYLIAKGKQAHLSDMDIRSLIESYVIYPHMYIIEKHQQAINKITKPQKQANINRRFFLENPNYNRKDKQILAFPITGTSLIGVLELLIRPVMTPPHITGKVGIRNVKNSSSGTTIDITSTSTTAPPDITDITPNFTNYVKNETFVPEKAEQGDLHKAVTVLAHFCIWFGTAPHPRQTSSTFTNLLDWYNFYETNRNSSVWKRQLIQYKQFTQNKIKYLYRFLPRHFKLINLLKEYCETQSDREYIWFSNLILK
uniref:Uncharacterized protein n=1 Tax=viral metagenome TaxID=1070528 RepID=A0A6C0IXJ9_9ZZZZ